MTNHKIINCNSSNLELISDKSVDLIVTSPPYPMIEMWDDIFSTLDPTIFDDLNSNNGQSAFEKMHKILNSIWKECDRVLKDGGFACINIGDATRTIGDTFNLYSNHTKIINFYIEMGYSVLPDIHWSKQSNSPNKFMGSGMLPAGAYVTYEHEYILVFRKGNKRIFDNNDKQIRRESAYFWEERNVWFSDIWNFKGTGQKMNITNASRDRNASFPFELPYRLINMYSIQGDTVLDPFSGLATTSKAAMMCKRNSIGIEIDSQIAKTSLDSLITLKESLNNLISQRIINHSNFISDLPIEKQEKCYINKKHSFKVKTQQEQDIVLYHINSVEKNSDNSVTVKYKVLKMDS